MKDMQFIRLVLITSLLVFTSSTTLIEPVAPHEAQFGSHFIAFTTQEEMLLA